LADYRKLFFNTPITEATDEYFRQALVFFGDLNETQREVLFRILRQVEIDTTSSLLSVLDGTSDLKDNRMSLKLFAGEESQPINGVLQDCFLALFED